MYQCKGQKIIPATNAKNARDTMEEKFLEKSQPMHEIEKYAVAHKLFLECWQNYSVVYGVKMPSKPLFETGSKGIDYAGCYYPETRTVWINLAYYHGGDTESLRETIAHEIAHHIVAFKYPNAKQNHGPEFRWVMQSIGYDGLTHHYLNKALACKTAKKDKEQLFNLD